MMVTGWRRAFCTSIPKENEPKIATEELQYNTSGGRSSHGGISNWSPRFGSRFSFFSASSSPSNPSTSRMKAPPVLSPSLRCRTQSQGSTGVQCTSSNLKSPRLFQRSSPSCSRSPSTFSLLKNSLRLSKIRCGICLQSAKTGQGTAIFTAECSHSFHFHCITAHVSKHGGLVCPVCASNWKELPVLAVNQNPPLEKKQDSKRSSLFDMRSYDDDEPLTSPVNGGPFNPIPESDENDEEDESGTDDFPGFFVTPIATPRSRAVINEANTLKDLEIIISPEVAVVSLGRSRETYAVLLKVKVPPTPAPVKYFRRPSIDLVTVLDVGGETTLPKFQMMKRAMKIVISSLSSSDRLSIVAFSAGSKRLLPLRRMTPSGRRSARRIIHALSCGNGSCANDALRKAAKVLEDRRECNRFSSILFISSDGGDSKSLLNPNCSSDLVYSTRFSHRDIPVHYVNLGACSEGFTDDALAKRVVESLSVVVSDLRLQLRFNAGSKVEIEAVYGCSGRPELLSAGSAKIGDLYGGEEKEILMELRVPLQTHGPHHLTVRPTYKHPSTQQLIQGKDQTVHVARPQRVRSFDPRVKRLRSLFVMTRAVVESKRLAERKDIAGAEHLLASARALLVQYSADECLRRVETEMTALRWRYQKRHRKTAEMDEKGEPLTPTSAWKAAERLAKVAIMKKAMNRVSDLHGFENARF